MDDNTRRGRFDYAGLKALAKQMGQPVDTLFVLSAQNDPFYIAPAEQHAALWFTGLWQDHGVARGHHLRRIHYRLVSLAEPVLMVDGKPYQNTEQCWQILAKASSSARHLGLVPVDMLVDRRNAEPLLFLSDEQARDGFVDVWRGDNGELTFPDVPELVFAAPTIPQRYHIELWAEKTTVNDILEPLARRYGCNVQTGMGELSITNCAELVRRAKASGKLVRILYISDFDPAGLSMPLAVARKIEHRLYAEGLELDIQVRQVVLTHEQCVRYGLPRTPIKATELRAAGFEARHGAGATELDALEAIRPGELERILRREVLRYYDDELDERIQESAAGIQDEYARISDEVAARHAPRIEELRTEFAEWKGRLDAEWEAISDELVAAAPDLAGIEWPEPKEGDEDSDPLFDTARDYLDQVARYKGHQGRSTTQTRHRTRRS